MRKLLLCEIMNVYRMGTHLRPGHTNYNIQVIVVILKVTTRFFLTKTLDYWKNYHDRFGVTHAQNELLGLMWFRFGGAESIVNNDNIGLSEHLSW